MYAHVPDTTLPPAPSSSATHSQKKFLLILAIGILVAVSLTSYLLWEGYRDALTSAQTTRRNLAWLLEGHLDASLRRTDTVLQALTKTLPADAYNPRRAHLRRPALNHELELRLNKFPELFALHICDADGDMLYSTTKLPIPPPSPPPNISDRDYFKALKADRQKVREFSKIITSRASGKDTFVVAYSVREQNGNFLGMVVAEINLNHFELIFDSINLGEKGLIAIRRTEDFSLAMLWPPDPNANREPLEPGHPNRERIASGEKSPEVDFIAQFDNKRRLFSLQRLNDYPFYILVGQTHKHVLSEWQRRVLITLLTGMGLALLMLWGIYRLRHSEALRQEGEEQISLLAGFFQHSTEACVITNANNCIMAVNPSFTRITGYTLDEVRGKNPKILAAGRTMPKTYATMWCQINEQGVWQGELWDRHKDGHVYPKWLTVSTIREAGKITHYTGSFVDITERKAAMERIYYLAHHDTLTRLPNRTLFKEHVEQVIEKAGHDGAPLALLFIDLDYFKHMNDSNRHNVGTPLLLDVAERLSSSIPSGDMVARLDGDEFVVCSSVDPENAIQLAEKLLNALSGTYQVNEQNLHISPSIGISLFPAHGSKVQTLMKHADIAMCQAKTSGRNISLLFSPNMNDAANERIVLENNLHEAIKRQEFLLHYQPQIDLASGRICGVEALVRWQHPERGMISPLKFIPLAEETGLIIPLGNWVLATALADLARWRVAGITGVRMAVNLSACQLNSPELLPRIKTLLQENGIRHGDLELEITESVAMQNPESSIEVLGNLRKLGIELAIDDFGTGYSSLAYLKLLPLDRLKLDRTFLLDIENDVHNAAICTTTISLAHSLGLDVVAEGVETPSQLNFLCALGCDVGQGYHFSRPLPSTQIEAFLRSDAFAGTLPTHGYVQKGDH
jgi:diguanylate cyclase (GGDEF)-like protein/PAS domain S-box-containing protein